MNTPPLFEAQLLHVCTISPGEGQIPVVRKGDNPIHAGHATLMVRTTTSSPSLVASSFQRRQ